MLLHKLTGKDLHPFPFFIARKENKRPKGICFHPSVYEYFHKSRSDDTDEGCGKYEQEEGKQAPEGHLFSINNKEPLGKQRFLLMRGV